MNCGTVGVSAFKLVTWNLSDVCLLSLADNSWEKVFFCLRVLLYPTTNNASELMQWRDFRKLRIAQYLIWGCYFHSWIPSKEGSGNMLATAVGAITEWNSLLTTGKAFATIAESPLNLNLSSVSEQVVTELTMFLRKANRALRQALLGTLNTLLIAYSDKISPVSCEFIVTELSSLISLAFYLSDTESHMTALALELCCTMMVYKKKLYSNAGAAVRERVLPQALILVNSSCCRVKHCRLYRHFLRLRYNQQTQVLIHC